MIHPKIKLAVNVLTLSLFLHQIWRNVASHQCLINGCSAVNGCRQNESLIKTSHHSSPSVHVLKQIHNFWNCVMDYGLIWVKNILIIDLFLSSQDVIWWTGVMFLSDSHSDGTHSLQSIRCWDTDADTFI